jgi:tetratricopeptide (TPR) repeat protein
MLRRAVELLPEDERRMDARRQLGDLLVLFLGTVEFDRGLYQEVRQLAEEILERDPRNDGARLLLGRVLILRARELESVHRQEAQKVLAEAIAELRQADALRPGRLEVVLPLAKSLWAAGDPKGAAALLESYLNQPDAQAVAFEELSRIYQYEQRFAEALRTLEQGVRRLPEEPRIYVALARLYSLQGRRQDLRALLEQMEGRARSSPAFVEPAGVRTRCASSMRRLRPGEATATTTGSWRWTL